MTDSELYLIRRSNAGTTINDIEDVGDVYVIRSFGQDSFSSTKLASEATSFTEAEARRLIIDERKWRHADPRMVRADGAEDLVTLQL